MRFTQMARSLAYHAGLPALVRRARPATLTIVCYHGITEQPTSPHWLLLPVRAFRRQIEMLARAYNIMRIDDAVARLRDGQLSTPTCCITFDDGYRNNVELAFPVLSEMDAPASVYLTTGLVGSDEVLWTTRLELLIQHTEAKRLPAADDRREGVPLPSSTSGRQHLATDIKEKLKRLPEAERMARMTAIEEACGSISGSVLTPFQMMSWADARAAEASGIATFGAHSATHPILSRLSDEALAIEINDSIATVRGELSRPSATFAYPNGRTEDFDARATALLTANGMAAGLTTLEGVNTSRTDPLRMKRILVGGSMEVGELAARAMGIGGGP